MMQRLLSLILVTLLLPLSAAAGEKSSAAVLTLKSTGAVPAPVQKRFDQKLRDAVKGHANVVDAAAGEKVAEGRCNESACLKKVAAATKARFVVSGQVSNADDIYKVSLTLYDDATDKVTDASQECELCAAEEVDKSIATAVESFKAAFAAPLPPPPAPEAPKPPPTTELTITSDPGGAELNLDGKPAGKTPYKAPVARGKHKAVITLAGHVTETREFEVGDRPTAQEFLLQVVATPATAGGAATAPASQAAPEAPVAEPANHRPAGIIMTVIGAVAIGAGTYFINLDGQVTCADKGRKECPDVYTTKWVGAAAMTVGGLALGSGVTLLVLPKIDAPSETDTPAGANRRRLTTGLVFTGAF
jgi:hypothetical protein